MSVDLSRLRCTVDQRPLETWDDDVRGRLSFATLFSGNETPTADLTSGLAIVPVGGWLGLHRHTAVETYYVLDGEGVVTLDGDEVPVGPTSSLFLPGDIEHGIRNTGEQPLRVFYVFAADSMSDIVYRFSAEASD